MRLNDLLIHRCIVRFVILVIPSGSQFRQFCIQFFRSGQCIDQGDDFIYLGLFFLGQLRRLTGFAVGMLFQAAGQLTCFVIAGLAVGMGFLAADIDRLRWRTGFAVLVFVQAAGQLPGPMAKGAMGVVFVLGKRTGQRLGINRFLHCFKAGVCVLML